MSENEQIRKTLESYYELRSIIDRRIKELEARLDGKVQSDEDNRWSV